MPIDLLCYARDSLRVTMKRRFEEGDVYFDALTQQWIEGTRRGLPRVAAAGVVKRAASRRPSGDAAGIAHVTLNDPTRRRAPSSANR